MAESRESQLEEALLGVHADAKAMAELLLRSKEEGMGHTVLLYKDEAGEWRWHRDAGQGDIVSDSGEGYVNKADCREMAMAVNGGDFELVELDGDTQN